MSKPKILVTGATGKTGSQVARQLIQQGFPVRAVASRRDARSAALEKDGIEVVVADLFAPEQMERAMRGTQRAYFCAPWHPHLLHAAAAFAVAARETRLEAAVALTQWVASPTHATLLPRQHWLADQLFTLLPDTAVVTLNPGFFADNYMRVLDFVVHLGLFPCPTGESQNVPPSNEDIARVAVACLADPDRHAGQTYRPTGPELLSASDIAASLSRGFGRRVRHWDIPMWLFLRAMKATGADPFEMAGVPYYFEEHRRGTFAVGGPTDVVERLTGRPAEDMNTIVRRHASRPDAQRTIGNTLRAVALLARIGLGSTPDGRKVERLQAHPVGQPGLAIDSPIWRASHGMPESHRI